MQMLQNGFDPNKSDYDKRTALMLACVEGHKDVVNTLLGAGADVTARDNFGGCALLEACKGKHGQLIELLVKNGATWVHMPPRLRPRSLLDGVVAVSSDTL